MTGGPDSASTFDLDHYLNLPRVTGLVLAPDGRRLVTSVATPGPDGKKFVSALWQLDPAGEAAPRRLTRSAPGEHNAAFLPDGSLLFTSTRRDPEAPPDDGDGEEEVAGLWLLPAGGGEARQVAATPAGIDKLAVAGDAGTVVYRTGVHPGADDLDADERREQARKDAGVTAQLFERYPIRYWDHYLGPREPRLFAAAPPPADQGRMPPGRPLTPAPGRALDEVELAVTPDGATVLTGWDTGEVRNPRTLLLAVDVASGERRVLLDDPASSVGRVACSPAGRLAVCERLWHGDPDTAMDVTLWLLDLDGGQGRDLLPGLDLWPQEPVWAADGRALFFVADQGGRTPVFRVEVGGPADGRVTRLCADGAFSDLCPAPDGRRLFALRAAMDAPPGAVALDAEAADQRPEPLPTPGLPLRLPGTLTEVHTSAGDGTPLRGWLVLPVGATADRPAPLVVFIHGGPLSSWSGWSWRWNPWLLAAAGYAVLLPDPALSTGYGRAFTARGRGRWGQEPYTDLMALVDAAEARPELDRERTAAMGGSFGGYLANWVAGQTDRFRCVVTHASIWSLEQFHGTTDHAAWWEREFGAPETSAERYRQNSPDRNLGRIRTPMLVIHGERDHRVPVSEALRLWTDLTRFEVDAKLLWFPDENHWILTPPHARLWYRTVLAFLDHHVLGKDWARPELL
jgi:dipeptidyl aminopeptidase/acylaminoacyl peptidase